MNFVQIDTVVLLPGFTHSFVLVQSELQYGNQSRAATTFLIVW